MYLSPTRTFQVPERSFLFDSLPIVYSLWLLNYWIRDNLEFQDLSGPKQTSLGKFWIKYRRMLTSAFFLLIVYLGIRMIEWVNCYCRCTFQEMVCDAIQNKIRGNQWGWQIFNRLQSYCIITILQFVFISIK